MANSRCFSSEEWSTHSKPEWEGHPRGFSVLTVRHREWLGKGGVGRRGYQ